jgi:DNA-binding response OmpR family regulator
MIIEDEPDEQDLLADVLALEGYEVRTTGQAAGALGLARRTRPDLIMLDLRLPGIGGLDLLRLLNEDPICRTVPVLLCTGSLDLLDDHADEISRRGALVLEKPYELDDLLDMVRSTLGRQRSGAAEA